MKDIKLTPEQVKAYEEMSGFDTTGDVHLLIPEDDILKLMDSLYVTKTNKED